MQIQENPVSEEIHQLMPTLQKSATWLESKGFSNARRECEWLFCAVLKSTRLDLYTRFDMPLEPAQVTALRDALRRRAQHEPLAYILGTQPFCGLEIGVGPGVLVPRPETEDLVAKVLAQVKDLSSPRLIDVGTGSGAIALALKSALPDAVVMAVDTSAQALQRASENAAKLQVNIEILKSDLLNSVQGDFDAVVANLPYIAEDEKSLMDPETAFEPKESLFAPDQGLALIRRLVSEVSDGKRLRPQGRLWLEIGFRQGRVVQKICEDAGFTVSVHKDEGGHDRFVEGRRA